MIDGDKSLTEENKRWWHAWGGVIPEGDFSGEWATVILGPSFVLPRDVMSTEPVSEVTALGLIYLASWDHEPSEDEKDALVPEEFSD